MWIRINSKLNSFTNAAKKRITEITGSNFNKRFSSVIPMVFQLGNRQRQAPDCLYFLYINTIKFN